MSDVGKAEKEYNGLAGRMQRLGWGRLTWEQILASEDNWKQVGSMVASACKALKADHPAPLDSLLSVALEKHAHPPQNGPHVGHALGLMLAEFHVWAWGFKDFGGRKTAGKVVPPEELTIYEQRHGLDTPGKWRKFAKERLTAHGLL